MAATWTALCAIPALATAAPTATLVADSGLAVQFPTDPSSPDYTVMANGVAWFASGPTFYTASGQQYSTADGTLKVSERAAISGSDSVGTFTGVFTNYTLMSGDVAAMATSVRIYTASNMAIFTQHYPNGLAAEAGSSGSSEDISSGFPSFRMDAWPDTPRGFVSFQGDMTGSSTRTGVWSNANADGVVAGLPPSNSSTGTCRVTVSSDTLHSSGAGYSAWTVGSEGPPRTYTEHPNDFCDCTGHDQCNHWAYHSKTTEAECQAQCDALKCKCFDFAVGGGGGGGHSGGVGQGVTGTGPVVVFDSPSAITSVVLSPYNNMMIANQKVVNGSLTYGVMASVQGLPKAFAYETVVILSEGINTAMDAWGDALLAKSGKVRDAYRRDFATQYLGYSTDNGAYYYYQTEPGKDYEDTLYDVADYAKEQKIPYRYVLLDSWWYFKGKGGGVATWDPRPDVFPEQSLGPFYEKTGWIGQLHNRYWSTDTPYATKNGGKYNFVFDGSSVTCPDDQQFWNDLIRNKSTGAEKMFMYEQDWLDDEYNNMAWLRTNVSAASTWLRQMNDGCAASNVTIQYCMSHVRHILESTQLLQVTNARASGDYHPGSGQWNIGTTSILAHAVGIAPSKDNYWSVPKQSGTHYGPSTSEPHGALQSAVLSLSAGPVCPSDAVGYSNASLILRACDASGRLLRPSKPATAIDAKFVDSAFGGALNGEVWSTFTNVSGSRYGYVLVPKLSSHYSMTAEQAGFASSDTLVAVHQNDVDHPVVVDSTHNLELSPCDETTFDLVTLSPKMESGWALLGEPNKWVSVSAERFSNVQADTDKASTVVSGPPGEIVTVAWQTPSGKVVSGSCAVSPSGTSTVTATSSSVSC
mmetsp:Transcript_14835/g.43962  ORF Transcript_14835/g.43962 Transcript_14835/m.43962 type:complete len:865 (-) Transcript_14835:64-2658(-)